jgi:phosphopantothenoylcysteine decarboxylase/phosphopantothenate--cysteine ligase
VRLLLGRSGLLAGRTVVVTAGGTQEPIDPVRAITNRSSGKQGFALAQAALDLGAQVTLVAGASEPSTPVGAQSVDVRTAGEMQQAVLAALPECDALLMAAAVADFRPASPAKNKIKKEGGTPTILLEKTPDILLDVARVRQATGRPRVVVGFAAESQSLLENASRKLQEKRLDMIAANDIRAADAGFGVDTNRVILLHASGKVDNLPLLSKAEVAAIILQRVVELLAGEPA